MQSILIHITSIPTKPQDPRSISFNSMILGVGDIIRLTEIAIQVARRLHQACITAPLEVTKLVQDVDTMHITLKRTATTLDEHGAIIKYSEDVKNGITAVFSQCEETLTDLNKIVNEYEVIAKNDKGNIPGGGGDWKSRGLWEQAIKNSYKRIKWTCMDDAIRKIREEMNRNYHTLTLVINSLQM